MIESPIVADDPFAPAPPDEVAELDALASAIGLAHGFTLLFACCNRAEQRDRLMADLRSRLPETRVQLLALRQPVHSLLEEVRAHLETPPPDAVFLFGIEGWLPFGPEAENSPFILNLNASRNYFFSEMPCPLVFWLPQHLLITLSRAAPDFCSVRSAIYSFCAAPEVRNRSVEFLTKPDMTEMAGLPLSEKRERVDALAAMLAEYESLPSGLRDPLAESRLLNSQATLRQVLGELKTAESLFQRALSLREATLGLEHADTASSLNNLAYLYRVQGRYGDAESLYHRALATELTLNGPRHPNTSTILNNLAVTYLLQEKYVETEPSLRDALEIREAVLGLDHPETALVLNNLGALYLFQRRYAEAEPILRRALAIRESTLEPGHPELAMALDNLASLYRILGRFEEAEELCKRSLAIYESTLGTHHHELATCYNNLALIFDFQGRYAEAEPLHRRALGIRESSLGPDHPHTATSLENYASLLSKMGREDEAKELNVRAQVARAAHARRSARSPDEVPSE